MKKKTKRMNNRFIDEETNVIIFGKYRGSPLDKLIKDTSYVEWMRNMPGFEDFITEYIDKQPSKKNNSAIKEIKLYRVEDKIYTSQDEACDHIRKLLSGIGYCVSLKAKGDDIYNRILNIIKTHPCPEKVKLIERATDIAIVNTCNSYGLQLIGTSFEKEEYVSWIQCATQKIPDSKEVFTSALRWAIQEQIDSFKRSNPLQECTLCGVKKGVFHVDHIILFKTLVEDFLKNNGDHPDEFDKDGFKDIFRREDRIFEEKWKKYHEDNARLRWLCATCNLTRPKKIDTLDEKKPELRDRFSTVISRERERY